MTRRGKVKIDVNPVADKCASPGERIVEYGIPSGASGLILFRAGEPS